MHIANSKWEHGELDMEADTVCTVSQIAFLSIESMTVDTIKMCSYISE